MDDSNTIKETGQGFFTEAGKLKSREQLRTENERTRKVEPPQEDDAASSDIESALSAERTRFADDANQVISALNVNQENAKEAQEIVKGQLKAARDLKQAIKDGNAEQEQKSRDELQQLESRRGEVAERIKTDNREQLNVVRKNLNFGNEQKGAVEVKPVEFEQSDVKVEELAKKGDINAYIEQLKTDNESLRTQRQTIKDTRSEVRELVQEVDRQITEIQDQSVRSYDEARKLSDRIANDIRQSAQAFSSNLSVRAVQALISG